MEKAHPGGSELTPEIGLVEVVILEEERAATVLNGSAYDPANGRIRS